MFPKSLNLKIVCEFIKFKIKISRYAIMTGLSRGLMSYLALRSLPHSTIRWKAQSSIVIQFTSLNGYAFILSKLTVGGK